MTLQITPVVAPKPRHPLPVATDTKDAKLFGVAQKLESEFISEMLKSAGFGKPRESFGGGAGEAGFASFLVKEQADKIVQSGGFGLAQKIYQTLRGKG